MKIILFKFGYKFKKKIIISNELIKCVASNFSEFFGCNPKNILINLVLPLITLVVNDLILIVSMLCTRRNNQNDNADADNGMELQEFIKNRQRGQGNRGNLVNDIIENFGGNN